MIALSSATVYIYFILKAYFQYLKPKKQNILKPEYFKNFEKNNPLTLRLFEHCHLDNSGSGPLLISELLKEMVLSFTLVYGVGNPLMQLLPSALFFAINLGILVAYKPLKDTTE